MVPTREAVKRPETLTKGKGEEALKHHVNVIIYDDFCQGVKEEKIQEGDFKVKSFLSFDSSRWCRPTPQEKDQPMESDENRPTHPVQHRSTPSMESVGSCEAVRIMTHEEFAA